MVVRITVRPSGVEVPPLDAPLGPAGGEGEPSTTPGAPLDFNPWDAVADERTIESGMTLQTAAREKARARQTLDEIAPPPPPEEDGGDTTGQAPAPAPPAAATSTFGNIVHDVGRGATEAPRQVVGGSRDATQAAIDGIGAVGDWLNKNVVDLGTLELTRGEPAAEGLPGPISGFRIVPSAVKASMPQLPKVKEATTVTGGLVRNVAQFVTGFVGAGKLLGAAAPGGFAGAAVKGVIADAAAFDAHEERLADLIQQVPALQNPVTDYLSHSGSEGELEGRFKRSVEGLGLGVAMEGLLLGLRAIKAARAAKAQSPADAAAAAANKPREAAKMSLIGDPEDPAFIAFLPTRAESRGGSRGPPVPPKVPDTGVPEDIAARALTPKGLEIPEAMYARDKGFTPLFGEGKDTVYVNFAAFKSDGDVKRVIADMVEAFKGDVEKARRGVRSNRVTAMASGKEDAWQIIMDRRRGEPLNAEQAVAVRRLWEASAQKLMDVAEVAASAPLPENLFQFRQMLTIHKLIQEQVIGARAETARALQSWQIPVGGGGERRLRHIENVLATFGGQEGNEMLARNVAGLQNLPDGLSVLDDVVKRAVFAKSIDVVKEIFINVLLSNPKTHAVNMLGNLISNAQILVERKAAEVYSQGPFGSGAIPAGEAAAKFVGQVTAINEAFRLFGRAVRTGESQFGALTTQTADVGFERAISSTHLGIEPGNALGKAVDGIGTIVNTATRFLNAEDDFFKAIAYRGEANAQAFRQASREVTDGTLPRDQLSRRVAELAADPPENIKLAAMDAATYATFTSKPGAWVTGLNQIDRRLMAAGSPAAQLSSLGLRLLLPFRNTPANLMRYTFDRTPLAPLTARYRAAIAEGGAAADIARTRMALGTTAMLAMIDLALDGYNTGGGPLDQNERGTRDTQQRAGWQPYSIKVGDSYISYRRTDPLGMQLGISADIADIINNASLDEDKREQTFELIAAASFSFANQVLNKSWMSSMSDFINVLRSGDQTMQAKFIEQRIGAFVPAVVGEIRRQQDPYMRYTQDLASELRNRIPGLSESLPIARDQWGRPRTYQSGLGAVYDALSPIAVKTFKPEPIDREALKNDFNLQPPAPNLKFGGATKSLRNETEVFSRYLEIRGQMKPSDIRPISDKAHEVERRADARGETWQQAMKAMRIPQRDVSAADLVYLKYGDLPMLPLLNAIVSGEHPLSEAYDKAGAGRNGGKDKMITRIMQDYSRAARERVLKDFPDLAASVARKQEDVKSRK